MRVTARRGDALSTEFCYESSRRQRTLCTLVLTDIAPGTGVGVDSAGRALFMTILCPDLVRPGDFSVWRYMSRINVQR